MKNLNAIALDNINRIKDLLNEIKIIIDKNLIKNIYNTLKESKIMIL